MKECFNCSISIHLLHFFRLAYIQFPLNIIATHSIGLSNSHSNTSTSKLSIDSFPSSSFYPNVLSVSIADSNLPEFRQSFESKILISFNSIESSSWLDFNCPTSDIIASNASLQWSIRFPEFKMWIRLKWDWLCAASTSTLYKMWCDMIRFVCLLV